MTSLLTQSATRLARQIRQGKLTSRQVVDAHIAHAQRVNPTLNAIVADRYETARAEADHADAELQRLGPDGVGVFHGVPCTIKECFALEGMPNSSGLKARQHLRSTTDATTVARIRASGAIPIGVTNTSELCMWMESSNPVYGRTSNPYDARRIVGGSSGGEGSIVGSGASPFGLGSDVGGSIRMPAFFNGVFGHKPSGGAVPSTGQYPGATGKVLRYLSTGPLARRAEDLMPLLRLMAGPDGHDAGTEAIQWPDPSTVSIRSLRVISIETNGFRAPSRELLMAQRRAAAALSDAGAHVEVRTLPLLKRSLQIWAWGLSQSDGGDSFSEMLGNGPPVRVGRQLARWLFGKSDHTLPALGLALAESIPALARDNDPEAEAWAKALRIEIDELLGEGNVILYPSYTRVAPFHRNPLLTPLDFIYTAVLNVMELPVTQVPLGLNRSGVPLGIQVAGPWGKDHVPIAVAQFLETTLGGWVPPSNVHAG
jgi:fatty acid amide hydrolase 2